MRMAFLESRAPEGRKEESGDDAVVIYIYTYIVEIRNSRSLYADNERTYSFDILARRRAKNCSGRSPDKLAPTVVVLAARAYI